MATRRFLWTLLLLVLRAWGAPAAAAAEYDAHAAFAPTFFPYPANAVRGPDGSPGPAYWQNEANYHIAATLDPEACTITGQVLITYINHSPQPLAFLWLELDQNIDRPDSRAIRMSQPGRTDTGLDGFHIRTVERGHRGSWVPAAYLISGTRMQIRLAQPLAAEGGKINLRLRYDYHLPASGGGGRSGILPTRNGPIFEVSYWYPRMCVFDDVHGWNILPFLGEGEFYLDYGDIDYQVTVPHDMLVAGSGRLLNPDDVLTEPQIQRLRQARQSDQAIFIRRPEEVTDSNSRPHHGGQLTWHFHMNHTRDVAWAASRSFVWDAARINLPGNRQALACSFYPVESQGPDSWGRATDYAKRTVEIFSRDWFVYPYPTAISVAGRVGGMEFPGFTFDGWKARNKSLWSVLSHEIGHTWFPMIVGSDERRNAWMDEGFNTFIDIYASQEFNQGEFAPKRDGEYAPHGGNPAEEIVSVIKTPGIPPIMSLADTFRGQDLHPVEYFKTAFGLVLLREVILDHRRFDYAFRNYVTSWAFKHPTPWDFFRTMDNAAGEDLSWFWRGWFEQNWQLDQAVEDVKYIDGNPAHGAEITLANLQQLPMPTVVQLTESGGRTQRVRLPVQVWEKEGVCSFRANTTQRLVSVVLDPDHLLPDVDRSNNTWKPTP